MLWLDVKYAQLISGRLPLYHVKKASPFLAEFRCIVCGDSQRNKHKRRGYLIARNDGLSYFCHNCGTSLYFGTFLKRIDPDLHKEYCLEKFKDQPDDEKKSFYNPNPNDDFKKPVFITNTQLRLLKKISSLKADHPAKEYVVKRLIPNWYHARLFYCPKFYTWVNTIIPDKFDVYQDEPRLIIPFLDKDLNFFGFQGRSFDPKANNKYITIMLNPEMPKVFGLDTIDFDAKRVYIVEGCIDSMFLPNCLAMAGADLTFRGLDIDKNKSVFILDNEPRNLEMIDRSEKIIEQGYQVCLWPENFPYKDINDIVMAGLNPQNIIDANIYQGLSAKLALASLRKV